MQFIKHDLGHRAGGEVVEVILKGNAANVRLMDSSNFQYYRSGPATPILWWTREEVSGALADS